MTDAVPLFVIRLLCFKHYGIIVGRLLKLCMCPFMGTHLLNNLNEIFHCHVEVSSSSTFCIQAF